MFKGREPGPIATIELHNGRPVWKMITRGDLGFAESYMDGDWTTPDLTALVEFGVRNRQALSEQLTASWFARLLSSLQFRLQQPIRGRAPGATSPSTMISAMRSTVPGWTRP